ncbi:hypothetical protein V6615_14385 [Oscillospiraceae bacterium PP1C4]
MNILLWPFRMVWLLIGFLFKLMGRLMSAIMGVVLLAVGILLTLSVVGAFIGIPLVITGFLLIVRSIF